MKQDIINELKAELKKLNSRSQKIKTDKAALLEHLQKNNQTLTQLEDSILSSLEEQSSKKSLITALQQLQATTKEMESQFIRLQEENQSLREKISAVKQQDKNYLEENRAEEEKLEKEIKQLTEERDKERENNKISQEKYDAQLLEEKRELSKLDAEKLCLIPRKKALESQMAFLKRQMKASKDSYWNYHHATPGATLFKPLSSIRRGKSKLKPAAASDQPSL